MAAGGLADSASTRKGDGMAGGPPAAVRPAAARAFPPGGRWVTPPALRVRSDARFYLAALPGGESAEVWPGELVDGEWVRPETALRRWEEGTALLHPPAWHTLRSLALGLPAALPLLQDPS